MVFELKKVSRRDGRDIYEMLQEIPVEENGFGNEIKGRSYEEFQKWLVKCETISRGERLESWMVPQSIYWLYADGKPVGMASLRHALTTSLRLQGGHIGYAIRPTERGKGYGSILLHLVLCEAKRMGLENVLLTIQNHNIPSIKVALKNGGVIEEKNEFRHFIWIKIS